jgi:hypothetical protein
MNATIEFDTTSELDWALTEGLSRSTVTQAAIPCHFEVLFMWVMLCMYDVATTVEAHVRVRLEGGRKYIAWVGYLDL